MSTGWYKFAKVTSLDSTEQLESVMSNILVMCFQYVRSTLKLDYIGEAKQVGQLQVISPDGETVQVFVHASIGGGDVYPYKIHGVCDPDTNDITILVAFHKTFDMIAFKQFVPSFQKSLELLILHEIGHKGRLNTFSVYQSDSAQRSRREFFRKRQPTPLGYRRQPLESDADVTAILGMYSKLSSEQKKDIRTYDDLFAIVPTFIPVSQAFWGESEKWRRYIISRLAREGLVLRR